ncbi:MAG: aldehyde ferredoxin oxidoreductase family protein [Gammaproteobacteria bacterium]|nr:aldehyde ferredoxin oxidoreductase family protein [Gammaproteobacteria bacterium]
MAWNQKVLRVDLSNGSCVNEALNMRWAKKYLGQRGLGSKYLSEEIDPTVDPLSADNKLIFVTGPLTGTCASTSARYSVVTKGPLTGAIACSNSGGQMGAELRMAGWDMVIFEGRSAQPVYLVIRDDKAELHNADGFIWGKTVWETESAIRAKHGDSQMRVAAIGAPGERGVLFSCIVNDQHRAAGRSGVGAVMGSKNLKAVAVRGTGCVEVNDPDQFMQATNAAKAVLAEHPVTGQGLPAYGTQVLMNVINQSGALPTRNARDVQFEGAENISAEAMVEKRATDNKPNLVRNAACFSCTIACGRISQIDRSHFTVKERPEYWKASGGLEYENAWSLGAANGVDDLEAITFINFLCNEHGLDPITLGATLSAAMELYDVGAISDKDCGGIKLKFGDARALVQMAEMTISGEGFGKEIGQGSKRLCEKYGHADLSMTVKGLEFPAYDPRGVQGMGLTYATSNRGACHVRSYTVGSEIMGVPVKTDPHVTEGKAELVMAVQDATGAFDSAGVCIFTSFGWTLEDLAAQVDAACSGEWTVDKLVEVGERIWNLERKFNLAAGLTGKDDTLPKRILKEAARTGPAKGMTCRLDEMLPEYYALRGWTKDGVPTTKTLNRLKL